MAVPILAVDRETDMAQTFKCSQCGPAYYDPCFIEAAGKWGRRCRCCGKEHAVAKRKVSAQRQRENAELAATLLSFMEAGGAA